MMARITKPRTESKIIEVQRAKSELPQIVPKTETDDLEKLTVCGPVSSENCCTVEPHWDSERARISQLQLICVYVMKFGSVVWLGVGCRLHGT